jgi:hypothetical protein
MQETMMNRLKYLVSRKGAVGNEEFNYQQHLNDDGASASSYRPPPIVTSAAFDNDNAFSTVAKALLYRFENEGLPESEAIYSTLVTHAERKAFLESLDLRQAQISLDEELEMGESPMTSIVQRTSSYFGDALREMWRESILNAGEREEAPVKTEYKVPPSPRNLGSPRSSHSSSNSSSVSSGMRRRRFFPDSDNQISRTRIRFDWKIPQGQLPAQSLQLDGATSTAPQPLYKPPSPMDSTARRLVHH